MGSRDGIEHFGHFARVVRVSAVGHQAVVQHLWSLHGELAKKEIRCQHDGLDYMLLDVFVLFYIQFFDADVGGLGSFEQAEFVDHIERNTGKLAVVHFEEIGREELAIRHKLLHLEQLDVLGTVQLLGLNQVVFDVGIVDLPLQGQKNMEFHLPEHSLVVFAFCSAEFHELVKFGNTISLCRPDKPASGSVSQVVDSFCVGELFGVLNVDKVVIPALHLGGYPETGGDYELSLVQENNSGGAVAVEKGHRFTYNKRDDL